MAGLNIQECCCSGPGLTRTTLAICVAPEDRPYISFPVPNDTLIPCWLGAFGGSTVNIALRDIHGYELGYDHETNRMYFYTGEAPYYGGAGLGISYGEFDNCSTVEIGLGFGVVGMEGVNIETLFDAATGDTIFANARPSDFTDIDQYAEAWAAVSKDGDEWRAYGFVWFRRVTAGPVYNYSFKAFSVNLDGEDYNEHFTNTDSDDASDGVIQSEFVPTTMTVTDGTILAGAWYHAAGSSESITANKGCIMVDGGAGAPWQAAEPLVIPSVLTLFDPTQFAAVSLGGQIVAHNGVNMFLTEAGTNAMVAGAVYLSFTYLGTQYKFGCWSIGWSHKFQGMMALWINWEYLQAPGGGGALPLPDGVDYYYLTLSKTALAAGNIIGQPDTTVHRTIVTSLGSAGQNMPPSQGVPEELGVMCTPVHFEGSELIPPDPPVPEPDCSRWDICADGLGSQNESFPGFLLRLNGLETGTIPISGPHDYLEEYLGGNAVGTYRLVRTPTLPFPLSSFCVPNVNTSFSAVLCDFLSTSTQEDRYLDPGRGPIYRYTKPGDTKFEEYMAMVMVETHCEDGLWYIDKFHFYKQRFGWTWDGGLMDWVFIDEAFGYPVLVCRTYDNIVDGEADPARRQIGGIFGDSAKCLSLSEAITYFFTNDTGLPDTQYIRVSGSITE